jgi:long-chain acyl-CoA synthetase
LGSLTVPQAFRRNAARFATFQAIRQPDRQLDFNAVDTASDRVAAGLVAQGVRRGDRVGLYCVNGPEFVLAYLGVLKAGASVVPVNTLLSPEEIRYILRDADVCALFYHVALADKAAAARSGLDRLRFGIALGGPAERPDDLALAAWQRDYGPIGLPEEGASEDVAAVIYTSGTTGYPKGAQLTHANLLANTASVCRSLGLRPGTDALLVVLPMFHSFAATVGMLTPLLHGMCLIPVPRFEPGLVVDHIHACGATVFLGVPSMYALFLKLPDEQVERWRSVRFCVSGGAALPVSVLERFEERFGIPVLEGDGPTECGPVTCVNPPQGPRKPGSVGLPIADVAMKILDENGAERPDGEVGEVCVRGPSVMKGYLNLPGADAESFFGEWFRTGDLGYRDSDGYFFLIDRRKDMIIVNGMNVYPRVVEEALYRHPDVAEAAVVGEPHPTHGEIPVAHLVAKPDRTLDPSAVRAWCRQRLGQHEVPRKVILRSALPKNATGKILKRELRRQGELERGIDGAS